MEDNKDVTQVAEEKVTEENVAKTYTKEELDASFNAGVKKAKTEWQKDEEYKQFLEWKKTNQNDSETIAQLQTSNEQLKKENDLLKATNEVAKSDVKPEFLKFVTSEVMGMVDDAVDFETALKNYKKENSQYFGEVIVKKVQSSPNLNNGGAKETTTNDIMNNILRSVKD